VRRGRKLGRPFLDIRERVLFGDEQGLLSIAFHPRYARNERFFVYYVNDEGNIEVDRFKRKGRSATRAAEGTRRKVIEVPHPTFTNHDGGQLQFGPDGFLYIGTGDGGSSGDPRDNAQNPGSLLGKLLRIDPGGRDRYRTPRSNPFAGRSGRDEIYSLGLRNPFRFSFDAKTGALVIGDVGQDRWEEIDFVGRGAGRGANFGWDVLEGNHAFEGGGNPPANYVGPIHEYRTHQGGTCAVTGGYVVRDRGLRALAGRYVYGDFCVGEIRSLDPFAASPAGTDRTTGLRVDSLSSFGEGVRNRLYATSLGGPVYRIVAR
jgi:glucose/arabinose dehydrogenase